MPSVRGCNLPDDLLYDVDNHIWFKEQGDGNVKIGMTAVATARAGKLVAFTPKRVGRSVRAGKSCATLESGKWVGPAKSAAGGAKMAITARGLAGMCATKADDIAGFRRQLHSRPELSNYPGKRLVHPSGCAPRCSRGIAPRCHPRQPG